MRRALLFGSVLRLHGCVTLQIAEPSFPAYAEGEPQQRSS